MTHLVRKHMRKGVASAAFITAIVTHASDEEA